MLQFLNPKEILERGKLMLSWAHTHILLGPYHHKRKYRGTGEKNPLRLIRNEKKREGMKRT